MSNRADVVVVGGGVAGLAAAAIVARRGLSCAVLERSSGLGGRAATTLREGFAMNLGGHALYRGGAAERVLDELGVARTGSPPAASAGVMVLGGERYVLPTSFSTLLRTRLFSAHAKLEFGQLLARLPGMDLRPLETVPLAVWLDEHTSHPRVRAAVETLVRLSTYANASATLGTAAAFRQLRLAAKSGVVYLDGGWQTLVDGLAKVATDAGVPVVTGSVVVEVSPVGREWRVTRSDGMTWDARSVILAVGPRVAQKMLRGTAKAMLETWADECVPARTACLDVGLRALPRPDTTFALGVDAPLYFSVHSNAARLAPPGCVMLHAMRYLSPDDRREPDAHVRELEDWLELCQPGWRDVCITKRSLPDMIATNDIHRAAGGARPGPEVPGALGLFVAGDWVGAEGMLVDASFASASEAARAIENGRDTMRATG